MANETVGGITYDENGIYRFNLRRGQSVTLAGIPSGVARDVVVTEIVQESNKTLYYTTTYTIDDGESVSVTGTRRSTTGQVVQAAGLSVVFTNTRSLAIKTGIDLHPACGIALLIVGVPGFLILSKSRKRKRKEQA